MYTLKKCKSYLSTLLLCVFLFSCSNIGFELPQGPQGKNGKSAYEIWKEEVKAGHIDWPSEQVELTDFLFYIKGPKGDKGSNGLSAYEQWKELISQGNVTNPHSPDQLWPSSQNSEADFWNFLSGADGKSPYIGNNGNWWIDNTDTGVKAAGRNGINGKDGASAYEIWKQLVAKGEVDWPKDQTTQNDFFLSLKGQDGNNGITPHIGSNGNWHIGSTDTRVKAQGNDGLSPYIGNNGNWWIGTTDTEVAPKGTDGLSPHIGNNGNWWIGNTDTNIPAQGQDGNAGASAYELWQKDVKAGKIVDKNGQKWPLERNKIEDFYDYLSGANGKSTYELWKEAAAAGKVEDPNNPEQKWPTNKVSENDFFAYLAGKDGRNGGNGVNGLSAYELWKNDLAKRCNTPEALTNHREGGTWDCEKNTLDDFYNYLRGKDGKDGEDGKDGRPGEPGKPGAEVTIVRGIPNVIAQYSQSEFGEYVRTTDGGVLYKVYDEQGEPAPRAVVKGMPGIDAEKTYTANDQGEFILPKEDLPEIQDINLRWGTVKEITLPGKSPQVSAKNTYVPNRVRIRMILRDNNNSLTDKQYLYFFIQRKLNPEDEWQNIPSYLPNSGNRALDSYQVSDKDSPISIIADKKLATSMYYNTSTGYYIYNIDTNRFIQENPGGFKNSQSEFWNGKDIYYTVKARESYYGQAYQWNGVCLLAPYQMGPLLKSIKLKNITNEKEPSFSSAEGILDFSRIDFSKIYKGSTKRIIKENGMDLVLPETYTEEEAKQLKMAYVRFKFQSSAGLQEASSSGNPSSNEAAGFKVFSPFLNSVITIERNSTSYFYTFTQGYLKKRENEDTYYIENYNKSYSFPEVQVTYEK